MTKSAPGGVFEVNDIDLVLQKPNGFAEGPIDQKVHGRGTQTRGQYPVLAAGSAPTLDMAQNNVTGLKTGCLGDVFSYDLGFGHAFSHNDDPADLSLGVAHDNGFVHGLIIERTFRDDDIFGPGRQRDLHGNMAAFIAHDLHHKNVFHALGRVADLVNGLQGGVDGCGTADGLVCAVNVIVNGSGQSYRRKTPLFIKFVGSDIRSVPTDDDQGVHVMLAQDLNGPGLALVGGKIPGPRGLEDGATPVDDIGHRAMVHGHDVLFQKPLIAAHDAGNLQPVIQRTTHDTADGRVHAWAVSAGSQNADFFDFNGHGPLIAVMVAFVRAIDLDPEVFRLRGGQDLQMNTHFFQMQAGDPLVEVFGQGVNLVLVFTGVLPQFDLGQYLVGE